MKALCSGNCVYAVVFWQLLFNHRTMTAANFAAFLSIDFTKRIKNVRVSEARKSEMAMIENHISSINLVSGFMRERLNGSME